MDISWALNQEVRWEKATGQLDKSGQDILQDMGIIPARFQHKRRRVLNADGEEVVSNSVLHTLMEIGLKDRITYNGAQYYPINNGDGLGLYDSEPSFYVTYL